MIISKNSKTYKFIIKTKKNKTDYVLVEGLNHIRQLIDMNIEYLNIYSSYKTEFDDSILMSEKLLNNITDTINSQNIIGLFKKTKFKAKLGDNILILDSIREPGNLGTILRTALSFNFKDVFITKNSVSIYNLKVVRSSLSAIFMLNIKENVEIEELKKLKDNYCIYSSILDKDALDYRKVSYEKKKAIVVGNEANGISKSITEISDKLIYIPITTMESLNVAVASGILMANMV